MGDSVIRYFDRAKELIEVDETDFDSLLDRRIT